MRLRILALALGGLLAFGPAFGSEPCQAASERVVDGPEVPFPLSLEIPFPWTSIEGVWEAHGSGIDALFSFEVYQYYTDRKILKVIHLDPYTGMVLAEGIGIAVDGMKIVRAVMQGQTGNYMLFIRAFKIPQAEKGPKTATVLTVRSFKTPEDVDVHVVIEKILGQPFQRVPSAENEAGSQSR